MNQDDFSARSTDELTLVKGERLELVERDDEFGDGWYLGRHLTSGKTGLFPEGAWSLSSLNRIRLTLAVYTIPAPHDASSTLPLRPVDSGRTISSNPSLGVATSASDDRSSRVSEPQLHFSPDGPMPTIGESINSRPSAISSQPPQLPRTVSLAGSENTVMHETLSVIDEHITDMTAAPAPTYPDTSEYRLSYINGHETEEEENHVYTRAEVLSWSPTRVAEYLEDAGVDTQHCAVFREQEISGEVLLAMEQSAIFIKEFELGSVGRRLKTWHKIKALHDEVRSAMAPSLARSASDYSASAEDSLPDINTRTRPASNVRNMSQYLSPQTRSADQRQRPSVQYRSGSLPITTDPPSSSSDLAIRLDNASRPSAADVRQINHTRRQSSMDSTNLSPDLDTSHSAPSHRRKVSLDRLWSMAGGNKRDDDARSSRRLSKAGPGHGYSLSGGSIDSSGQHLDALSSSQANTPSDAIRDYESSGEDPKQRRRFLPKRLAASVPHSRSPSDTNAQPKKPVQTVAASDSPIVTKLEYGSSSPAVQNSGASSAIQSPATHTHTLPFFNKPKLTASRTASDAVTTNEKLHANMSPLQSPTRTGSTTPSTENKSFEIPKADLRISTGSSQGPLTPALPDVNPSRTRPRARSKKFTSAYLNGLERRTPAEQMAGCDYSGWMKKRSANIMGTWKARLFVLRGRRLSYYYNESDTEEKGLIDISGHRVLPADDQLMTGLHAQITGAGSSPVPDQSHRLLTSAAIDLAAAETKVEKDDGPFIFKLVPPREGMSKAVNFTKPAVHYFIVSNRHEGRLWMAALMKATIDSEPQGSITTSYNQDTISLAKARARREAPPDAVIESQDPNTKADRLSGKDLPSGLGIGGLETDNVSSTSKTSGSATGSRRLSGKPET